MKINLEPVDNVWPTWSILAPRQIVFLILKRELTYTAVTNMSAFLSAEWQSHLGIIKKKKIQELF